MQIAWILTGFLAAVPRPGTPVRLDVRTVQVWSRSYEIGHGGLPDRITSNKVDLLARPVMLEIDGRAAVTQAICRAGDNPFTSSATG